MGTYDSALFQLGTVRSLSKLAGIQGTAGVDFKQPSILCGKVSVDWMDWMLQARLRCDRGLQNQHRLDQVRVENLCFFPYDLLHFIFNDFYMILMRSTCVPRFPDLHEFWFWSHSCLLTSRKNPSHGQVWLSKKKVPSGYPWFPQSSRMLIFCARSWTSCTKLKSEAGIQKLRSKESTLLHLDLLYNATIVIYIPLIQETNGHLPSTFIQTTRRSVLLRGLALDFSGWTNHRVEYPCGRRRKNNLSCFFHQTSFFHLEKVGNLFENPFESFAWNNLTFTLSCRSPKLIFFFGQVYWGLCTTIDNLPAVSVVAISFWSLPQFGILAENIRSLQVRHPAVSGRLEGRSCNVRWVPVAKSRSCSNYHIQPFCSCLSMSFFWVA